MPHNIGVSYLAGMLIACLAVPLVLWYYWGPLAGALGATAAAALWFSQYRVPAPTQRSGPYFWFVAGGYGLIAAILLGCLGRLFL